jgi:MoaA/NifB/PqqE/SkfB family radical SAM enzyme
LTYQNHINYNCEITLEDGETFKVYSQWLNNEELNYWKGWECSAGRLAIVIKPNDDVYGCVKKHDYLGNLNNEWDLMKSPVICRFDRCAVNTLELSLPKQKNGDLK